jgi:sigma-B regulation protein RsbU (phosphoserine phosphatase)
LPDQALAMYRDEVADIISGTVFLFFGFAACAIAAMRPRSGTRVIVWLGIWSAMYGSRPLLDSLNVLGMLPRWFQSGVPYIDTVVMYLILVVAALAWLELSLGGLRFFLKAMIAAALTIALAGIVVFVLTGAADRMIPYNQLLATCSLAVLVTVVAVPGLSRRFLAMPNRGILLAGTLVFGTEAFVVNLLRPMGRQVSSVWDSIGFAALLFAFGYVAVQNIFANERRFQSIENELVIAREIQASIIPGDNPKTNDLRISAAYRPMTYVAGDFYDFIPVDRHRVGFLVADVSGHGVPAALIAAMIKVAIRSVLHCAHDPREVLRGLNRSLFGQLRNQFVTASYLWIDTEARTALYSAAGHPPLIRYREGKLERIESNGLLFGVIPEPDFPVRTLSIKTGDRYLLCTDGLLEPESPGGDSFGDCRLEQVMCKHQSGEPSELVDQLLFELRKWQSGFDAQQDDITFILVDVV